MWVVAAAGGEEAAGDMLISWTLGEPGVGTVEASGMLLTVGFQQGNLVFVKEETPDDGTGSDPGTGDTGDDTGDDTGGGGETGVLEQRYEVAQLLDVSLFPNPAATAVKLRLSEGAEPVRTFIEILDATGRLVRSDVATLNPGQPHHVSVEPLLPGIYFVRLRTADKARVLKFVKE